jgi:amidase
VDVLTATASDLQEALSRRAITSTQIIETYLDQIGRHNHAGLKLHAVISTAPRENVLNLAKQLDEERERGTIRSPLNGIPILVKVGIARCNEFGM